MPVEFLLPTADGANNAWTLGAGASKWGACTSNDGDTSYITATAIPQAQSFQHVAPSLPVGLVNTAKVSWIMKNGGGGAANVRPKFVRADGTNAVNGVAQTSGAAYGNFVSAALGNPYAGGGTWNDTDIRNAQMGVETQLGGAFDMRVTYVDVTLDYVPAALGGLTSLVIGLVGPLVAVGLDQIPGLVREIAVRTRGRLRFRADEYAALYRELREARYARHFLMGAR